MKAVWQGSISFGLVDIPIKLYSATEPRTVSFKLLCKKCKTPITYKRYCPKCKKEVTWDNVVYGLKVGKSFKVFTREQLDSLKPAKSDFAAVLGFIEMSDIDPIYFQKSYYVAPETKKEKAFYLFQEALRSSAKVAVVKITMRNKEYLAMIRPYKHILLMTTLLYQSEIRKVEGIEVARPKISSEETKLANQLIRKYSKKELNLEDYKDEFAEKIKEMILGKVKPEKHKAKPKPEKLLEALKMSVK